MLCDIDHRDDLGPGWLQCRNHPNIWRKDVRAKPPQRCPLSLVDSRVSGEKFPSRDDRTYRY